MNSKIISISDNQNTITHESGFVSVFKEQKGSSCIDCVYYYENSCGKIPCSPSERKDYLTGIFTPKND